MPIEIDELIDQARENCAYAYANVELDRHALRTDIQNRHPSTAYFFSTEPKRHMSSLMYKAFVDGRGVTASEAAEKLKISRQAANVILTETTDAGWTVKRGCKYMYSLEMGQMYTQAVSDMLLEVSTGLTENIQKLVTLREIASTYLTLTSEDRSNDNDVSEVKYG
jgi:CTP-dependent riboflavin kinase